MSLDGVRGTEARTEVLASGHMTPLLRYLARAGDAQPSPAPPEARMLSEGLPGLESPRGIVQADGRLGLYKAGVGAYIDLLVRMLRTSTFVRHLQLGNIALGRPGCAAIAR